jgi:nucleotidyltransferase/DNA polymerase involved in DNA repair
MMDVTGTTRLFGAACDVATTVQQAVLTQYRLEGVAGVGSNKLVAQTAASLIEPSELYDVRSRIRTPLLCPRCPCTALPGIHRPCMRTVLKRLDDLNLRSLGDIAESPLDALEDRTGALCWTTLPLGTRHRSDSGPSPGESSVHERDHHCWSPMKWMMPALRDDSPTACSGSAARSVSQRRDLWRPVIDPSLQ